MMANEDITVGNICTKKGNTFKCLSTLLTNKGFILEEIKYKLKAGNA